MALEKVKAILFEKGFECEVVSVSAEQPFERLLVFLEMDPKNRERSLEIYSPQQGMNLDLLEPKPLVFPLHIQFRSTLPFKVQNISMNQVASALFFLNQMLDLPGFELNELEGKVLYRYVWLTDSHSIHETLVMSIVGAIQLNLNLFSDIIEQIAENKILFNDLLKQIISANKEFTTKNEKD